MSDDQHTDNEPAPAPTSPADTPIVLLEYARVGDEVRPKGTVLYVTAAEAGELIAEKSARAASEQDLAIAAIKPPAA